MPSRKSKQAGGNFPLTYYERTKKFASSEYGTTSLRLAGHSQYQLGDCGLTLSRLGDTALCSPSGHLYEPAAMLEYLLEKNAEIKELKALYDAQQADKLRRVEVRDEAEQHAKKKAFIDSQKMIKRQKLNANDSKHVSYDQLKSASYWLSDSQPQLDANDQPDKIQPPSDRPLSPHSQDQISRKELWEVKLQWQENKLVCSVSNKVLRNSVVAYWTSRQEPGRLVSQDSLDLLDGTCHETGKKIKYIRKLQSSGTSFSGSAQQTEATMYRPTIT
ncbi:hypothetical protein MPSEU_000073700 [Mayamaea pseudoterrestris]|nr:hypothetical protein MPSEU_000073700 [Mayamaea pseudoterrestris]